MRTIINMEIRAIILILRNDKNVETKKEKTYTVI